MNLQIVIMDEHAQVLVDGDLEAIVERALGQSDDDLYFEAVNFYKEEIA